MLLKAYACGIFPMAENADDPLAVLDRAGTTRPDPLDGFHVSRRLARTIRSDHFEVFIDRDFEATSTAARNRRPGGPAPGSTGGSARSYCKLHEIGHCHSVETWRDGKLVGGLYGVRLGRAFFGESMFHRERDASKVALVHLVAPSARRRLTLFLDTQFVYVASVRLRRDPRSASGSTINASWKPRLRTKADFFALDNEIRCPGAAARDPLRIKTPVILISRTCKPARKADRFIPRHTPEGAGENGCGLTKPTAKASSAIRCIYPAP